MLCYKTRFLGFLILVTLDTIHAHIRKVKRSPHGQSNVVGERGWGRRDAIVSASGESSWSSNTFGSTQKRWVADATAQEWSQTASRGQDIDYDYSDEWQQWSHPAQRVDGPIGGNSTEKHLEAILRGVPGVDFPNYISIPDTQFDCNEQTTRGYYGDVKAECQVFHICQPEGRKDSFLCPLGTIFNQKYFVCDWWFNFNCSDTPQYYQLNEQVYKDEEDMTMRPWNNPGQAKPTPNPSRGSRGPSVFRGKSLDEWSSAGKKMSEDIGSKTRLQTPTWDQNNGWKGHVGKVSDDVVWNRSAGRNGVQNTSTRPSTFSSADRTTTKSSSLLTKKNANVPANGNIKSWPGRDGRANLDRTKPSMNEAKQPLGKNSRPVGFGVRTQSSSSSKDVKPVSWKPATETVTAVVSPSYGRKALSQTRENVNKASAAWHGSGNVFRKNVPGVTTTSPATLIRPTGTRGVWEQESTAKTNANSYTWKLNGSYQKGTVRKSGSNNLKTGATEISNLVTSNAFSSFGKRKGIIFNDRITTHQPSNIKSDPLKLTKQNNGDHYTSASIPGVGFTQVLLSTPLSNVIGTRGPLSEHGKLRTTAQTPVVSFDEGGNMSKYEHVGRTKLTVEPIRSAIELGVDKITDNDQGSTTGFGKRNPKRRRDTETKTWNSANSV